jgi:tRNA/tmRNA/rRNA uracil-C5-methylase (TrmA/RlmC/RlmD family)
VCDARATRQLLPDTCAVVERLAGVMASMGLAAAGDIELTENVDASERAVHLDMPGDRLDPGAIVTRLEGVSGLSAWAASASSTPRAPSHVVSAGEPHVVDVLDVEGHEVRLRRHVLAFFQANRYLLRSLVVSVLQHVQAGMPVMDLYAGVGLFAVSAALVRGARVTAVEGDRAAAQDLVENARSTNGLVVPLRLPVEAITRPREQPSTIIVDPPRTGMSREALDAAIAVGARSLVYVSCDVATLARDARRMVDAGYELRQVEAFDLFPNTPHVETVASFFRN